MSKDHKKDWKKFKEENKPFDESSVMGGEEEFPQTTADDAALHVENGLDHPSYLALEEKLTLAEQEKHKHWEQAERLAAEIVNVRRRAEREVENAHRYGVEKLISSLLPVIDSLEQALQMVEKEPSSAMTEGLQLTIKLFLDALQKFDVQPLNPQGEIFNPQEHEAMSILEAAEVAPNTVITVFQKGYKLNDRVIRPARVIVSKNNLK